ncbi:MAG: hypothetical protein RI894_2446 [Bacteroidota bacterium]
MGSNRVVLDSTMLLIIQKVFQPPQIQTKPIGFLARSECPPIGNILNLIKDSFFSKKIKILVLKV